MSARADELDRVRLLELGADDYVVKPFGMRELVARIRAVTRRSVYAPDEPVDAGALKIELLSAGPGAVRGIGFRFEPPQVQPPG